MQPPACRHLGFADLLPTMHLDRYDYSGNPPKLICVIRNLYLNKQYENLEQQVV